MVGHEQEDSLRLAAGEARTLTEYGHSYRITVTRSNGSATGVETTVPPRTTVTREDAAIFPGFVTLPVIVAGGAPRIHHILITYFVVYRSLEEGQFALEVPVSYEGTQVRTDGGWKIPLSLRRDYQTIERAGTAETQSGLHRTLGIRLDAIGVELVVASEDWDPPGGRFDPEVIVQPDVMSNVENGYGFLAAGYRHDIRLDPQSAEALRAAGFVPAGE